MGLLQASEMNERKCGRNFSAVNPLTAPLKKSKEFFTNICKYPTLICEGTNFSTVFPDFPEDSQFHTTIALHMVY
jgi:hypothetical protein